MGKESVKRKIVFKCGEEAGTVHGERDPREMGASPVEGSPWDARSWLHL